MNTEILKDILLAPYQKQEPEWFSNHSPAMQAALRAVHNMPLPKEPEGRLEYFILEPNINTPFFTVFKNAQWLSREYPKSLGLFETLEEAQTFMEGLK